MKVKSFKLVPILVLFVCCLTNAFADGNRPNVKINSATPMSNEYRDDGWLDGRRGGWTWHGDQGLYNFTTIKNFPSDELNQKPIVRFGGAGTYVFGDYAVTGKPVISLSWPSATGSGYMWGAKGTYIKDDGDGQFYLNSSKAVLRLPKGVTKNDIVYARLYWQGNIFSTTDFDSEAEYNSKDGKKLTGFAKWYTWVKFKMKSSKGTDSIIKDVQRDRCEGTAAWNFLAKSGKPLRLRLKYGCTKDITDLVKQYFEDYSDSIEFTVGNVRTSDGMDPIGADFTNGEFDSARIGPYGGWGIIIVYDKNSKSRKDLMENLQSSASVTGKKMTYKEALAYKNNYFKPKNVTIYGDYLVVTPWNNGYTPININATISGFYTPRSGSVNAKLGFLGFGGERKMTSDEYFKVQHKETAQMDSLYGSSEVNQWLANDRANIYDGSVALLINDNGTYKYSYPYGTGYLGGFDLDEFDISSKMKNAQSSLNISLGAAWENLNGGQADQNFISMIAISADLYVPQMCYQYEVYTAREWLKFYDYNGTRIKNYGNGIPKQFDMGAGTGAVVPGESIFYRVRFENRNGNSEDAVGTKIMVNFGDYNTYTADSSAIDNRLTANTFTTQSPYIAEDAEFVYLKDNEKGPYETMRDVLKGANGKKVTTPVYKDRQFNSTTNNRLTFYIGKDAGDVKNSTVNGGLMKPGDKVYAEFNATVNSGTIKFVPPTYTVGYNIQLNVGGKTTIIQFDDGADIEECTVVKRNEPAVMVLNGLQVVNQNFKDGKATDQDDRLFTQASELPFDANLIFRPNLSSLFKCKELDASGNCVDYDTSSIPDNYKKLFKNVNGKTQYSGYSGTEKLQEFNLPGKLFLSVIDAKQASTLACKLITDTYKIPFKLGDSKKSGYRVDHEVLFNNKKILELKDLEIADAYKGLSFMLSYRPDALDLPDSSLVVDTNITAALQDRNDYYIEQYRQKLLKEAGYYKPGITKEEKENIEKAVAAKIAELTKQLTTAQTWLGTAISSDGTFHICNSDSFVLRPAYFDITDDKSGDSSKNNIKKYAKLVDVGASGDITRKGETADLYQGTNLRLGGDYEDNVDMLNSVIYPKSAKNNGVPNYNAVIGDMSTSGAQAFRMRNSYNSDSDPDDSNEFNKISEVRTYLRPFISNQCYNSVESQSLYIEKDKNKVNSRLNEGVKQDGCQGGIPIEYKGFKYNASKRVYEYDGTTDIKSADFGKYAGNCSTAGTTKNFDVFYTRVWDKTATKLWANFGYESSEVTDGYISKKKMKYAPYLMNESKKDPTKKDIKPALLYTAALEDKGEIFNYYNVGDVLVNVYDNSWTDNYGDQTYIKNQAGKQDWVGTTCIINSSTNKRDELGRIGCDVGMKDNKYLVLRYKPDRIILSMTSLDNASYAAGTTGGAKILDNNVSSFAENLSATAITGAFTYYSMPDVETDITVATGDNPTANKAVTRQLQQLATIKYDAIAYLSNKVYKDVVATLYDGGRAVIDPDDATKTAAVCGFASDLDLQVNFSFDCSTASGLVDGRCLRGAQEAANLNRTAANVNYSPYQGANYSNVRFTIPSGTEFFAEAFCATGSAAYDSRCFKYNVRTLNGTTLNEATGGAGYQLPIPLNMAINYYTNADLSNGFVNARKAAGDQGAFGGQLEYNPKDNAMMLMARGFSGGRTPNAKIYFNFDRMHKTASRPIMIYAEDFNVNRGSLNLHNRIEPASFDKNYDMVSSSVIYETYDNSSVAITSEDFDQYLERMRQELAETGVNLADRAAYISYANGNTKQYKVGDAFTYYGDNVGTYALFVYGKANEPSDGATIYEGNFATGAQVGVQNSIYCGQVSGCATIPVPQKGGVDLRYLVPNGTIFNALNIAVPNADTSKFITNTLQRYNSGNIQQYFVSQYLPENAGIRSSRDDKTTDGVENTTFTAGRKGTTRVEVITNPWLIYTPTDGNSRIWINGGINTGYTGAPQYFNYFFVQFLNAGTWGGEGGVKSGTEDDVGSFAGGNDLKDTAGDSGQMTTDTGEKRTIRNQRIDW